MRKAKIIAQTSISFVTESTSQRDIDCIITPEKDEQIFSVPDTITMEEILVMLGKFPSKGQARKNGWSGPVPDGFNAWQIGKFQFVTLNMKNIT